MLATTDGAGSWAEVSSVPGKVTDLHFLNRQEGWLVTQNEPWGTSKPPVAVYRTTDGGAHWQATATLNSRNIEANFHFGGMGPPRIGTASSIQASVVVSTGLNLGFRVPKPALEVTSDTGKSWTRRALPAWRHGLAGSAWASASDGWVLVGETGTASRVLLMATGDGGRSWRLLATMAAPKSNGGAHLLLLAGLSSEQPGLGWLLESWLGEGPNLKRLVKPKLLITADGGLSWTKVQIPHEIAGFFTHQYSTDLGPIAAQVLPGGDDWLLSMALCVPARTGADLLGGATCGQTIVWHSTDGGTSWVAS